MNVCQELVVVRVAGGIHEECLGWRWSLDYCLTHSFRALERWLAELVEKPVRADGIHGYIAYNSVHAEMLQEPIRHDGSPAEFWKNVKDFHTASGTTVAPVAAQ